MNETGTLVLTTPTPLHQAYLAQEKPDELQIVDETVCLEDLIQLASDIDAIPIVFEWMAIWSKFDYAHFVASRSAKERVVKNESLPFITERVLTRLSETFKSRKKIKLLSRVLKNACVKL